MRIGLSSLVAATSLTALGLFGIGKKHQREVDEISNYKSGDVGLSNQLQLTLDSLRNDNRKFVDNIIQEKENLENVNKKQVEKIGKLEKQNEVVSSEVERLKKEVENLESEVVLKDTIMSHDVATIRDLYKRLGYIDN